VAIHQDSASFRDPFGYVFHKNDTVFRAILSPAKKQYEAIRDKGLIQESIAQGFLIESEELALTLVPPELNEAEYVIKHKTIPFISYPYEWSFYQLKAAALHHLKFQLFLLDRGALLRDASAYNIQFVGTNPTFIDLLSIAPYKEGDYWLGHRQFCEQFLNPLLLHSLKGITHFSWFRGNLEGISTSDLSKIISLRDKLSWKVFFHVSMHARLSSSVIDNPDEAEVKVKARKPLPKSAYKTLITQLCSWIEKLEPKGKSKTVWGDYANNNTYLDDEAREKREVIFNFSNQHNPKTLIDLGCNSGDYSITSLQGGAASVIGYDFDPNAIDIAYKRSHAQQLPFLPLHLDAANPSPNQGWMQIERQGFKERAKADAVIALAFIHHLAIGKNIPLNQVIQWITDIAPRGLIEFVPKTDETVRHMLALREDIFTDYTEENFIRILSKTNKVLSNTQVSSSGRNIFEFSRMP
jgi:ribosomal protein L11 methylase PrmA